MRNKKIAYFGTSDFAAVILKNIFSHFAIEQVITRSDKKGKRGTNLIPSAVKKMAIDLEIPFLDNENLSDIYAFLKKEEYDFFIVASYGKILPKEIIDLPLKKTLNVHASLLPKYRGASPIQFAILNGDKVTGNTIMEITPIMDAGPIYSQSVVEISDNDNTQKLTEKLATNGSTLLINTLSDFSNICPKKQNESQATYTKILTKKDGYIDWKNESAIEIFNKIRALGQNPGCYSLLKDLKINFYDSTVTDFKLEPGLIVNQKNKLLIGSKDLALEILKLQVSGKSIITGTDFINGFHQFVGKKLN